MPVRMMDSLDMASGGVVSMAFDPKQPIPHAASVRGNGMPAPGQNQRDRRSIILATIRMLLIEEGFEGVTVRRVAECSGHAVQTIYNLVGPRDLAITEAITEYSQFVNLPPLPDLDDTGASVMMLDRELQSIQTNPEFCRNVCLIFFTESRDIFYDFRARQVKSFHGFMMQQQKAGIIRAEVNVRSLAEQLVMFLSALCVEWSDRPFAFDLLRQRLYTGYSTLMSGALCPSYPREMVLDLECAAH